MKNNEFLYTLNQNKLNFLGPGIILIFILTAIFGPLLTYGDPFLINQEVLRLPPFFVNGGSFEHLLGTDDLGRDILTRLIYGSRISFGIGISVVFISGTIGTFLGLVSGFYGGKVDWIIMRVIDIIMAFPSILLAIIVVAILGPDLKNAIIAVSIVAIPNFTRLMRSSVLSEKKKQYVDANIQFGASSFYIMFKEILPNCMAPLIVQFSLGFSDGILNAAALGFLGLGAKPPTPEWGTMLADSRNFIQSDPWMITFPGLAILLVVLGFNLFGDTLRDFLDPRLKK